MDKQQLVKRLCEIAAEKKYYTLDEIAGQSALWKKTWELYQERQQEMEAFLQNLRKQHERLQVIFTGAGTSNYVGDVLLPYVQYRHPGWTFHSIPTTDLVSNPREFFAQEATLLVSFARSGNSPESVAAVELGKQCVKDFYQLNITCAQEGKLALNSHGDDKAYLFLLDERCNDRGFAMTSSYTCMTLAALLIFGLDSHERQEAYVERLLKMGEEVNARLEEVVALLDPEVERVVYLGSGALGKLTREAQLKILELTAGRLSTCFDSSMGFRHGPKSFINDRTLIIDFVSNQDYTRQYDADILAEMRGDHIAKAIYAVSAEQEMGEGFCFRQGGELPDAFLALAYIVLVQYLAAYAAIMVENNVDNPSASGTVNRVVKGVTIHPLLHSETMK